MNELCSPDSIDDLEIAIIGMSCRVAGAENIDAFWQNLRDGEESISFFSEQELLSSGIDLARLSNPNYVKASAVLTDIELFDAYFFGFSPREAEIMDPQHRLFLERAWEALESAGYDSEAYDGRIGVYAGVGINTYLLNNLYPNLDLLESVGENQLMIASDKDFVPTRVSYKLNLKGPSVNIQTACSTSLVAVHLACQSLLNGECNLALAGGVSIKIPPKAGYFYQEGGIASPDGHCRAFDANAQGTVRGSGVGIVVLKRLADALADGDCIHAVIKGSAINNDGSLKVGYTAPSVDGQAEVITEALAMAEIEAETITYIEAHGTGTALGDPIEVAALTQAFRASTQKKGFCAIGSVKTNVGHLDAAAGVAGLIKTVLALKHKLLPPSLHFERPNPKIDFANSPFYVNTTLSEWKTNGTLRRAGVSSFGIGGTNAHVVLEEAPLVKASSVSRPWQLLLLSAKTSSALDSLSANLAEHLKQHPGLNLADVAYTLSKGRRTFNHRRVLVCQELDEAAIALSPLDSQRVFTNFEESRERPVVFMFPGQGAQYVNMALELYQVEPTFREEVDYCCELLKPQLGIDLRHVLYPSKQQVEAAKQQLNQTAISQPVLFVIEYALAKLWIEWGIRPQVMIGHSIGEYVAACLAGVFSLENALALVVARGRMMQELPGGTMMAVPLSEEEVQPLLGQKLSLAAINGSGWCTISGPTDAVDELEQQLAERGVDCRRLHTSHAFHSEMMDPIVGPFTKQVTRVTLKPPQIPYVSNVTGTWITVAEATDPSYWARHLRQTVRFAEGVHELLQEPDRILLEVGPGETLSTLAERHPDKTAGQVVLSSLRHPQDRRSDMAFLLNTLGNLWLAGVQVDWSGVYTHERRHRLPLPTYAFERQRYWIEPNKPTEDGSKPQVTLGKKPDIADWFYIPSWKRSMPPKPFKLAGLAEHQRCWLVFVDECGLGSAIVKRLQQEDQDVITVIIGQQFSKVSDGVYTIQPRQRDDYDTLLKELRALDKTPQLIVHLWSVTTSEHTQSGIDFFEKCQELGFYSLLFLAQALGKKMTDSLQIRVVSNNMQDLTGEEELCSEKATVLGPCKVIPQEYPNITCRSIDVVIPKTGSWQEEKLIDQLIAELTTKPSDLIVAYRGNYRWVQAFEAVRLDGDANSIGPLRENGVYLITDGLGGIGLLLAEYLARTVQAKLILIERSAFPKRDEWGQWLATHNDRDDVSRKIGKVQALGEMGAEVLVVSADVANQNQMQAAIAQAYEQFGEVHGVIHAVEVLEEKSFRTIQDIDQIECERHFHPKVHELFVLEKVLQGRELDFCLLQSSLSSVLGGLGFVADAAANLFVDALAHKHNQTNSVPWISMNWDVCQLREEQDTTIGATLTELAITPEEGLEAFQRVFCMGAVTQVVVSTGDLQARIDQWIKLESLRNTNYSKEVDSSLLHPRPNLQNAYVPPRDELERSIADIWQELLGIEQVGIYDNFFDLGGHSLLAVRLMAQIQKEFGQNLPLAKLFQGATIGQLASILRQQTVSMPWSALVAIQPGGSKRPLFCVHPAGGNVFCYVELAHYLGSEQPFYGLQALGLDEEQEPLTQVEDMAAHYIEVLQAVQPQSPYLLAGYSFGGLVAFEMAQQLQAQGQQVSLLALLDTYPSSMAPEELQQLDDAALLVNLFAEDISLSLEHLRQLESDEQLIYVIEQFRQVNLLPPDFRLAQARRLLQVYKINSQAARSYIPQNYSGLVTLFQASEGAAADSQDPNEGWRELAAQGVETYRVPGDHKTMVRKPHVQVLAERLRTCLEQSQADDFGK